MSLTPQQAEHLRLMGIDVWRCREPSVGVDPIKHGEGLYGREPVEPNDPLTMDWDKLGQAVAACQLCSLCETRMNTVFGVGALDADWMIIGEAPGANEDRQGEPFVGRAGQLLNSMLGAIGLERGTVFIANTLKCRPPGNRDPAREETSACAPYLIRQIQLVQPKVILAVGRIAAQTLLETEQPLGRLRGRAHRYQPTNTALVVTYHPAYLLRSPAQKKQAWEDLKLAHQVASAS